MMIKNVTEIHKSSISPRVARILPLVVGVLISVTILALRALPNVDFSANTTGVLSFAKAFLKEFRDSPYLALIPIILTQIVGTSLLVEKLKDSLGSSVTHLTAQNRELREFVFAATKLLQSSHDLNENDRISIAKISQLIADTNRNVSGNSALVGLLEWRKSHLSEELMRRLDESVNGTLSFSSDEEIGLNYDLVAVLSPKSIKAVSIDDALYWESRGGRRFVMDQLKYLRDRSGAQIERLFLEKQPGEYDSTIEEQRKGKIKVGKLDFEEAMAIYQPLRKKLRIDEKEEDFVIYDDLCVKKSRGIGIFLDGVEMKDPELIFDPDRVKQFVALYERLSEASRS